MKAGLPTKKLGDICNFEGGSQPPKSNFIYDGKPGYIRFLQIRDFGSDKNITFIPKSKKNRLCEENDILIGRYGASVGKILTSKAGAYNVALMKTIPNLEVLDRSWFYYYLISDEFQNNLLNVAARSAQAGFSKEDIYNFPVPVPPLSDQRRIVGILDEAFDGIATAKVNTEKNLQNARAIFESHLQSVFTERGEGWVEKPLGEMCERITKGSSPKWQGIAYVDQPGILFVTSENVGEYQIMLEQPKYVEAKFNLKDKKSILQKGDVLTNIVGASIGRTAVFDRDDVANINQAVCLMRCEPHLLDSHFLTY